MSLSTDRKLDRIGCAYDTTAPAHFHILYPADAETLRWFRDIAGPETACHLARDWAVTDATVDEIVAALFAGLSATAPEPDEWCDATEDHFHDTRISASHCQACDRNLCEICGGNHATADGHDLSDPRYWGV